MVPVEDPQAKRRIVDEILAIELQDTVKASQLQSDGTFERVQGEPKLRAQAQFMKLARRRAGEVAGKRRKRKKKDRRGRSWKS